MQVRVTGTTRSGERIDFETDASEELAVGDSFTVQRAGQPERVVIASAQHAFTPAGITQTIWTVEPQPEWKGPYNPAAGAEQFDGAEERLRVAADEDFAMLGVVRQATNVLSWALAQSDMPQAPQREPLPTDYAVGTALLFLGVIAHRATRATMALLAVGYEPEALGLKRLLTEAHSYVKSVIDDRSGEFARQWLVGRTAPRKAAGKHADLEVYDLYSESAHADIEGVKSWLLRPDADGEWGVVGSPERRPDFANAIMVEVALEVRDIAVALASIRGLQPPRLAALDRAINDAEDRYLESEDDASEAAKA